MIKILIVCIAIAMILTVSEVLWRKKIISSEVSRKLVHIFSGVVVAFLPAFVSYGYIQLLSLVFLMVVFGSLKLNVFRAIHSVKRITVGEVMYPVGIGVCALIAPAPWIFTVAILHLAVADALAAMVGSHYGKKTSYKLFGHKKSWHGTLTFLAISIIILSSAAITGYLGGTSLFFALVLFPGLITLVENFSWWGIDNLTIPLLVVVLLSSL